ncbi:RNA polymerase sigma factor RpoH [Minicystis rosea]|nr:RNA polymerase sigma factor RpoH [Minicystis rosea]
MNLSASTALSTYRHEVARQEIMTPARERELLARHRSGERDAARRLVEGCLGAVLAIAVEYRYCGLPIEDLVQEGNVGLLKSLASFDPERGLRLAAYAGYWIRAEIRQYVVRHYRIVRLGTTKSEQRALWLYRRTKEACPEALAAMSGLTPERAAALLPMLMSGDVSLSPAPHDEGRSCADRLADHARSPEDAVGDVEEKARFRAALSEAIAELSERQQDIIQRRVLADDPETLEALALTWSVSRERVRQIEEQAKARLRARLEELAADVIPSGRAPAREARPTRARGPRLPKSRTRGSSKHPATASFAGRRAVDTCPPH